MRKNKILLLLAIVLGLVHFGALCWLLVRTASDTTEQDAPVRVEQAKAVLPSLPQADRDFLEPLILQYEEPIRYQETFIEKEQRSTGDLLDELKLEPGKRAALNVLLYERRMMLVHFRANPKVLGEFKNRYESLLESLLSEKERSAFKRCLRMAQVRPILSFLNEQSLHEPAWNRPYFGKETSRLLMAHLAEQTTDPEMEWIDLDLVLVYPERDLMTKRTELLELFRKESKAVLSEKEWQLFSDTIDAPYLQWIKSKRLR